MIYSLRELDRVLKNLTRESDNSDILRSKKDFQDKNYYLSTEYSIIRKNSEEWKRNWGIIYNVPDEFWDNETYVCRFKDSYFQVSDYEGLVEIRKLPESNYKKVFDWNKETVDIDDKLYQIYNILRRYKYDSIYS